MDMDQSPVFEEEENPQDLILEIAPSRSHSQVVLVNSAPENADLVDGGQTLTPVSDILNESTPLNYVPEEQKEISDELETQIDDAAETIPEADSEDIGTEAEPEVPYNYYWNHNFTPESLPLKTLSTTISSEFGESILKGCLWAPDGSCLLTNSEDKILRLFNLPTQYYQSYNDDVGDNHNQPMEPESWTPVVKVKEGGQVYDYCWFPLMNSSDPVSSCFLSSAAGNPIHLWDAFDGSLRGSYLAYNAVDVIVSAHSITFDPTGLKIYSGYEKTLRIFDLCRPGRQCVKINLKSSKYPDLSLPGIVSCIAVAPNNSYFACGSFESKKIGLYLVEDGSPFCVLKGHRGGLTEIRFSPDGTKLYSGGRKDPQLRVWDLRNMGAEYQVYEREVETNQRITFDLSPDGNWLISGGTDGKLRIWDTTTGIENETGTISKALQFQGSTDCINGVSLNPYHPLLAISTGQRHFQEINEENDDDDGEIFIDSQSKQLAENVVRLFKI